MVLRLAVGHRDDRADDLVAWRGPAADQQPFDFARLAAIPPDELETLVFTLHPSAQLIRSPYPLLKIWQVNQPEYQGEMTLDWNVEGDRLLIARRGFEVEIRRCEVSEYAFLQQLVEQKNLHDALAAASLTGDTFDLQGMLTRLIQADVISGWVEKRT